MTNNKAPSIASELTDSLTTLTGIELQLLSSFRLLSSDRRGMAYALTQTLVGQQAEDDEEIGNASSISFVVPGKTMLQQLFGIVMPRSAVALLVEITADFGRADISYIWDKGVEHMLDICDSDIITQIHEASLTAFDSITVGEAEVLGIMYRAIANKKEGA